MEEKWLIAIVAITAIFAIVMIFINEKSRAEQRKNQAKQRHDMEQQARALMMLSQAVTETTKQVQSITSEIAQRQDRLRDSIDARIDAMQSSNEKKLEQMRETVSDKLDKHLTDSFKTVNDQLARVHTGLGQMQELAGEFSDLKKVLGGVKTRGIWGEMQLRGLLEETLSPTQYIENAAIPAGSQTRVEFAVKLPAIDGEALLPIDSKFPQEDFLRLNQAAESGDAALTETCARQLERALTEQAKLISTKYIRPPQTADFAVMFLPVESLYAEAVKRPGLCEMLQSKYRVLVAGPNTLAALLTSLRMGFRTVTLERRSGEVLKLLESVRAEFEKYEESVGNVRHRLEQATDSIDEMQRKAKRVTKLLKDLGDSEEENI